MDAEELVRHHVRELQSKEKEIKRLKKALQSFMTDTDGEDEGEKPDENDTEDDQMSISSNEVINEDSVLHDPSFDGDAYRCNSNGCGYEVVEGQCQCCGKMYSYSKDDDRKFTGYELSIGTDVNLAIHPDRSLVPRGNTPLLEFLPTMPPDAYLASNTYPSREARVAEYHQLLQRGATRLMCETFQLSFTADDGIYALADPDLVEEFGGPEMKEGDVWKIHLGRCIELAEDDMDGSAFIEALLEDAFYFALRGPASPRDFEKWQTIDVGGGVWVTKMMATRPVEQERMEPTAVEIEEGHFFADGDSDEDDPTVLWATTAENEDRLLDHPEERDHRGLRANDYEEDEAEHEDDSEIEEEEVQELLLEYYPQLTQFDALWDRDDEGDDVELSSEGDSFDSDFDSEEEMSGDEMFFNRILQDGSQSGP